MEVAKNTLTIDANHPLARTELTLRAAGGRRSKMVTQRGGSANNIAALVAHNGPGMQMPVRELVRHTYNNYPFRRHDEGSDELF